LEFSNYRTKIRIGETCFYDEMKLRLLSLCPPSRLCNVQRATVEGDKGIFDCDASDLLSVNEYLSVMDIEVTGDNVMACAVVQAVENNLVEGEYEGVGYFTGRPTVNRDKALADVKKVIRACT